MRRVPWLFSAPMLLLGSVDAALADDVPVVGLKLIIVDKLTAASKAKAVFVAKDMSVTKGSGTDPTQIEASLDIAFDDVSGTFEMPAARFEMSEIPRTLTPIWRHATTSGIVDMPTASAPHAWSMRTSAGVS